MGAMIDALKGAALIGTFIGVFITFAIVGLAMGECVASLSRACSWCSI